MGPAVSGTAGPVVLPGGHRFVLFAAFPAESFCPLHQGLRSVLRALRNTLAVISDAFETNLQFYKPGHLSEKESLFSGQEHNGSILAGAAESDLAYLAGHKSPLPVVLMNRTLRGNVIFCNHEGIARDLLCALSESGIAVGQDLLRFSGTRSRQKRSEGYSKALQHGSACLRTPPISASRQIDRFRISRGAAAFPKLTQA